VLPLPLSRRRRVEPASSPSPFSRETHDYLKLDLHRSRTHPWGLAAAILPPTLPRGRGRRRGSRRHRRCRACRLHAPPVASSCPFFPGVCEARDGGTKPMDGPCVSRKEGARTGGIKAPSLGDRELEILAGGDQQVPSRRQALGRSQSSSAKHSAVCDRGCWLICSQAALRVRSAAAA